MSAGGNVKRKKNEEIISVLFPDTAREYRPENRNQTELFKNNLFQVLKITPKLEHKPKNTKPVSFKYGSL